ncbi:NUDIX domain-containing protein [Candidatus Parcubacteria bacterium]|nr:MAG: NUDIX domain-containing protein [Candidatus Parcubacteria bacterium]
MENEPRNINLQVGVKALLKRKDGKYLLIRRSPVKYPEAPNRWDIVGGRINPGETLLQNLKREIKEETNLDLIEEPELIAAQDILKVQGHDERHVVRLTYIGNIEGEPTLDTEENVEYAWFTLKEIEAVEDLDIYFKELLDKNVISG